MFSAQLIASVYQETLLQREYELKDEAQRSIQDAGVTTQDLPLLGAYRLAA